MLVNCAANDASTISCEGMIKITKNGQFTDSYLKQNTLLLHKNARVDSVPSLEIDANEVKAGHGSAISRVKDSDVFYLQSRGINKKDAQNMYVHGFLQSMTKDFASIPYVAERTMELVANF
jgi:Fe-S cluster assembly protein SufD